MTHATKLWQGLDSPQRMAGVNADAAVLLAFSGGADSTALLQMLLDLRREHPFPLILAHVNHGIRGAEALRDRDFCVAVAEREGLEICVLDVDVPSLAAHSGRGLEEEARLVRYAYFERLMRERKIPILVTAHHANDQLETVLFRLARGTGLHGLGGIAPVRKFANGYLVRPLLRCSRAAVEAFCREHGLSYVTDSTNDDPSYARNRLRGEVIPILEELFPRSAERVSLMAQALREDDEYLCAVAHSFLAEHKTQNGLPIAGLQILEVPICKRVLRLWTEEEGISLEGVHLEELMRLLKNEAPHARVALPNGRYACVFGECLILTGERFAPAVDYCLPFAEGTFWAGDTGIQILVTRTESLADIRKVHNLSTAPYINLTVGLDIITKDAYWRPRRAGDGLLLRGMHRKLRKLYAEAGIPLSLREKMPLLCDGDGVLWAPGVGCRDGAKECASGTGYYLQICLPCV